MTDQQTRARELLAAHEEFVASLGSTPAKWANELRAALDENLALRAEVGRLKGVIARMADGSGPLYDPASVAFTGRRTARDRADIPTNAGVPLREAELREVYEQECGGTISYDESRIDTIASNGNTGEHYK